MRDINFRLHIHEDAEGDLEALYEADPDAAAEIVTMLEEIEGDQKLLSSLLDHGFNHATEPLFNVTKFVECWRKGEDIWRIRSMDFRTAAPKYRVLYAYLPTSRAFHVLGVVPRSFNYDAADPFTKRIRAAYADLP